MLAKFRCNKQVKKKKKNIPVYQDYKKGKEKEGSFSNICPTKAGSSIGISKIWMPISFLPECENTPNLIGQRKIFLNKTED